MREPAWSDGGFATVKIIESRRPCSSTEFLRQAWVAMSDMQFTRNLTLDGLGSPVDGHVWAGRGGRVRGRGLSYK